MSKAHANQSSGDKTPGVTMEGETFPSAPKHIDYLPIDTPEPGGYAQVAPDIVWLRIPMPMDLNHINLWLLDEGDGWTLIDTGINADMAKQAWESIIAAHFAHKPLKRIFLTHLHPDHIGLARWLQDRFNVPAWMSTRGAALLRRFATPISQEDSDVAIAFMNANGLGDREMLSKFFTGKSFRAGISGIPDIAYAPSDGEQLSFGATQWQVYETDGHAEGHHCLFSKARNILISGDQVLPTISSNVSYTIWGGDKNPLASYLASLAMLSELDNHTLVLPSHGRPFYGLRARAQDLIGHHRAHLEAIIAACAEPKTAFELVPVLFKRRLIGAHWMFAMGETIAHAEYLAIRGDVGKHTDSDGKIRYARSDA